MSHVIHTPLVPHSRAVHHLGRLNNEADRTAPASVSIVSLLPHPSSVTVGGVTNLTVTISAPQGSNTIISTSSDNTSVATVPSTVTVTAGNTTAIVPVTGVGIGSANILATLTNAVSANITVSNPSGLWPNEPAGSILLNDNNFNVVVGNSWVDYSGDTTIAVDPTAPASPSNDRSAPIPR